MSMAHERVYECTEVGIFTPADAPTRALEIGDVGYVIANIKSLGEIDVGDTITSASEPGARAARRLPQGRADGVLRPLPERRREYDGLRDALEKLKLNDAALVYEPESSVALGFGFRCGFLGLLHMEIVQERLERDYDLDLIATSPSVVFRVTLHRRHDRR